MRGRLFLALMILTMAMSIGCGGGSGTHQVVLAGQPVAAGQLVISPSTLDFGEVPVGQTVTKTGTLTAGNAHITVTSADWKGEGYSVSGIAFPLTVAAGQSVPFKVTFMPQKDGNSPGTVSFFSDASNSPRAEVLRASATQASAHSVTLSWRSSGSNIVAYNIYRGVTPTGPFSKINTAPHPKATFTDGSVQGGQVYFYVTTAVNKHGKESKHSNQVQVAIPNS